MKTTSNWSFLTLENFEEQRGSHSHYKYEFRNKVQEFALLPIFYSVCTGS